MADLLGSILGSMEKPPTISDEQKKKAKAEEEKWEKLKKHERLAKEKFQNSIEKEISKFLKDNSKTRERLKPMNKLERSIVHEMAEEAGLITQAFGVEEHDRHVMLFKKENPPSEDEINAYKRGEVWNVAKEQEILKKKKITEEFQERLTSDMPVEIIPSTNYRDKYNHILGTTAAIDAAKKTEANKSFGMVPSVNKRDQRSIEETLNEIRAKKKQKTEHKTESDL